MLDWEGNMIATRDRAAKKIILSDVECVSIDVGALTISTMKSLAIDRTFAEEYTHDDGVCQ